MRVIQLILIIYIILLISACEPNIAYEKDTSPSKLIGFASGLPPFDETAVSKYEDIVTPGYFHSCMAEDVAAFCARHPENEGCNKYCHDYYVAVHLVKKGSTNPDDIRQLNFPMSKKGVCQNHCNAKFGNSPYASYIEDISQENHCICFGSTEEKIAYYASLLKKYNLYT